MLRPATRQWSVTNKGSLRRNSRKSFSLLNSQRTFNFLSTFTMIRFKASNYRVSSSVNKDERTGTAIKPVDRDRNRINLNIVLHGDDDPEADGGESLHGIGVK